MTRLKDKVIIVTGGSGLLGKAMIKKISSEGAFCVNADLHDQSPEASSFILCDITSEISVTEMISNILTKHGRIDGLVNNAYPRTKDWGVHFEDIPLSSWQKNVDMQLNSIFLSCQKILPVMQRQGSGCVINISSIYGSVGPDFSIYAGTSMTMPAAYSAIKGGIINFTRYLAAYYGPSGVRVNCVSPGGVFDNQNTDFVQRYEEKVPLRRMATPEDISPSVAFLLSDDASYITGQNVIVDGGWTIV